MKVQLFDSHFVEKSNSYLDKPDNKSESDSDYSESKDEDEEKLIISSPANIKKYNKSLIDDKENPSIIEYVKNLNDKFYKIDISFIDDFLNLIGKNECNITYTMLKKYGLLSSDMAKEEEKILESTFNFPDNLYNFLNFENNNEYLLTPYSFKIYLMRSQKTIKYANYFLLLEDCFRYFNDFQMERNLIYRVSLKKIVKEKDCKIDELKESIERLQKINSELKKILEE